MWNSGWPEHSYAGLVFNVGRAGRDPREGDMIMRKKIGRTNFLAINRESLRGLQDWLAQYHTYWGSDKETLENYLSHLDNINIC